MAESVRPMRRCFTHRGDLIMTPRETHTPVTDRTPDVEQPEPFTYRMWVDHDGQEYDYF